MVDGRRRMLVIDRVHPGNLVAAALDVNVAGNPVKVSFDVGMTVVAVRKPQGPGSGADAQLVLMDRNSGNLLVLDNQANADERRRLMEEAERDRLLDTASAALSSP